MSKSKVPVSMFLPQSKGKKTEVLYELFRRRVKKKSHDRNDEVANPTQLILAFPLVMMDVQMGVVVSRDSFKPLLDTKGTEIGFAARIESVFGVRWLHVYKTGKAYMAKVFSLKEIVERAKKRKKKRS